jgi:hypothetical protein
MEPVILVLSFQVRELSAEVLGPRDARCHRCERDRSQHPASTDAPVGRKPLEVLAHAVEFL